MTTTSKDLELTLEKSVFDMLWVNVNGKPLASVREAKDALAKKPWLIDRWMKQSKLSGFTKEEFVNKLTSILAETK